MSIVREVPAGLVLHKSFSHWKREVEPLLAELEEKQFVPFAVNSSVLVSKYNQKEGTDIPEDLKYFCVTFACIHYGQKREKGIGLRPNQSTFKTGCQARLRFHVDLNTMKVVLTRMHLDHNHEPDAEDAELYPKTRRLTAEESQHVAALMDLEVRPALLQNVIKTSTHKQPTQQDLRNIQQRLRDGVGKLAKEVPEIQKLMKEIEEELKEDPNGRFYYGEENGDVKYIFWASSEMIADFEAFPEVVSVDTTYNVNNSNMPLTLFLSQNQHGNGRLAGICLMKDEKQDTLRGSFESFQKCYSASIHKLITVFVDKSLNEISRVWEVLPNVEVHLCRFHCVKIFNENSTSEPSKVEVRRICKAMLYCETEDEYNHLYADLEKVWSQTFEKYFKKNWHTNRAIWKGYQRLDGVTFGLTTTNSNESMHGKLKQILNRRVTITACFRKVRLMHKRFNFQAAYKNFLSRTKLRYVSHSNDPTVQQICSTCTEFASSLVRLQLEWSYKMEALSAAYPIDTDKCTCAFYRSRKLPCCHIFFSRRLQEMTLFSVIDVPSRWRLPRAKVDEENNDIDDDFGEDPDGTNESPAPPPLVLLPSCPLKTGGKPLSKAQKYNKFLSLCAEAGQLASICGGKQFLERCNVIETVLTCWRQNLEVSVTPVTRTETSSKGDDDASSHLRERPSVIVQISSSPQASPLEQIHTASTVSAVSDLQREETVESEDVENSLDVESTPLCKCKLPSVRFIPKYGKNMGRTCYECPKKLPEIPCGFLTVSVADPLPYSNVELTLGIHVQGKDHEQNVDQSSSPNHPSISTSGITRIQVTSSNIHHMKDLKLPVAKTPKGRPKLDKQRTLKKSNKPWSVPKDAPLVSDRDRRRADGLAISDDDVSSADNLRWEVRSQAKTAGPDDVHVVERINRLQKNCFCDNPDRCVHSFSCSCKDHTIRKKVCKHIYKVQNLFVQSISEDSSDEALDSNRADSEPGAQEDFWEPSTPPELFSFIEAMDTEMSNEASNNDTAGDVQRKDRNCIVCAASGPPSSNSAHKCAVCKTPVHSIGCSAVRDGGEEGSGGTDRLCWSCHDKGTSSLSETNPVNLSDKEKECPEKELSCLPETNSSNSSNFSDKASPVPEEEYSCFGCQQQRVSSDFRGKLAIFCPDRRVSHRPLSRGRAFYVCPNPINEQCATAICTICDQCIVDGENTKCCQCGGEVHVNKCSTRRPSTPSIDFITEERVCRNCFCLLCRHVREENHKCICCSCSLAINNTADSSLCYRCERVLHSNEGCSKKLRAKEKNNEERCICSHCFAAMVTGLSSSARSDILNKKLLSDEHMARASAILSAQFNSTVDGLCAPLAVTYGAKVDSANYYPSRSDEKDFVQIIDTGRKHWVTAIFQKGSKDAILLDSSRHLSISGHTEIQVAMIAKEAGNSVLIIRPPCKQQTNGHDCGPLAIANATEYCFTESIQFVDFDISLMRSHLLKCLESGSFTQFPRFNNHRQKKVKEDSLKKTLQVWCVCRLPSSFGSQMVCCELCDKYFHTCCVELDDENLPDEWLCNECQTLL